MKLLLAKIYSFSFLNDLVVIYPVYALMFQDHGLSMTQISLLLMIWSGSTVLLEVPTGVIADNYSRRNILFIAKIIKAFAFLFWLGQNFYFYALGFILWALASALHSGTFSALVYDELVKVNQEPTYEKVSGRFKMFTHIAVATALASGGFIAEHSYTLALILSMVAMLLTGLIALTFSKTKAVKSTKEENYYQFLNEAIKETKNDNYLKRLILLFVIAFGFYGSFDEFGSIVLRNFGLNISTVGLVFSGSFAIFALAGFAAPYLSKLNTVFDNLPFLVLLSGIFFLAVSIKTIPSFIIFILFAQFLLGVTEVKAETKLQHRIKSEKRATILSINSLLRETVSVLAIFLLGFVSQILGISSILWVMSSVLIGLGLIYFIFPMKKVNS